jgi:hypothetical protein
MKLLGSDHIGIVVRDIDETIARAGDMTAPQTTFGVTQQLMEHKGRGTGA